MRPPHAPPESLSPELAARLAEFAKACKAATRVVSMYPPSHPTIQSALARIGEADKQATQNGPFTITVLPDALLVDGRGSAAAESSASELAALLHQQLIGELTLFDRLDNDGWHAFLTLLAQAARRRARRSAASKKAWEEIGNKSIAMTEIDYADSPARARRQRRERDVGSHPRPRSRTTTKNRREDAERGGAMAAHDWQMAEDAGPARRSSRSGCRSSARRSGDDSIQQRKSLLELMHGLANYAAERKPDELDSVLRQHGRRRGADVAGHAADAHHRSAAAAVGHRRAAAWISPASCRPA